MAKYFIVIDMQNDFVTGSLANPAAAATIPFIKNQIEHFKAKGYQIVFTRDTHYENYMETGEGKHLPVVHCVKATKGWEIVPELNSTPEAIVIDKEHFGYDNWKEYIKPGDEVVMCGTVTSICVNSNAIMLKAIEGVEVTILAEGCSGLSNEDHEAALKVMEMCQCKVIRNLAATVAEENAAQEVGA